MQNIDKIKNNIGEILFNHITSLNKEDLLRMKLTNDTEITNVITGVYKNVSNEYYSKIVYEGVLINYMLS